MSYTDLSLKRCRRKPDAREPWPIVMKTVISEKLNAIEGLEQRKLLKDILADVFMNLVEYQEKANNDLAARVFGELAGTAQQYSLYATVMPRSQVDPLDTFLYPVCAEDMRPRQASLQDIVAGRVGGPPVAMSSVFMRCDSIVLEQLLLMDKRFHGTLVTDKKSYAVELGLRRNGKYLDEIKTLYAAFRRNDVDWTTINNPYATRFLDVVLTGGAIPADAAETITDLRYDLEECAPYAMKDMVLVWNIERLKIQSPGFPMPAQDRVHYEHRIALKKTSGDHGWLVAGGEERFHHVMRGADEITIFSAQEEVDAWDLLKVTQPRPGEPRAYPFLLASNRRADTFLGACAHRRNTRVRTRGEISRILASFEAGGYFTLQDIVISGRRDPTAVTRDVNYFIVDDIRTERDKKTLTLICAPVRDAGFIAHDLLSFLVSAIQLYFPEYVCEGVLR